MTVVAPPPMRLLTPPTSPLGSSQLSMAQLEEIGSQAGLSAPLSQFSTSSSIADVAAELQDFEMTIQASQVKVIQPSQRSDNPSPIFQESDEY